MIRFRHFLRHSQCKRPDELPHMLWSFFITLINLYFIAFAILLSFFDISRHYVLNNLFGFNTFLLVMLFVDMIVAMNRGVYVKGIIKTDRPTVLIEYLSLPVFLDISAIIMLALSLYLPYAWATFLSLWVVVKLHDINRFDTLFFRTIHTRRNVKQLYIIFKIVLVLSYINHLFGCVVYYMDKKLIRQQYYGSVNDFPNFYWLATSPCWANILQMSTLDQYLYTMYFSISLLTTIAYGDILTKNPLQSIFMMFLLLATPIVQGVILEQINDVLMESFQGFTQFINQLTTIVRYMRLRNVSDESQRKVRAYLEYLWYSENFQDTSAEKEIIQKLPKELQKQLFHSQFHKYFLSVQLFSRMPHNTFEQILMHTTEQMYGRDHNIIDAFSNDNRLLFLEKGQVSRFYKYTQQSPVRFIKNEKRSRILNCLNFITNIDQPFGIRATIQCNIISLPRDIFIESIKNNDQAYQVMCYGRDQIILYDNIYIAKEECWICSSGNHNLMHCPQCHFKPTIVVREISEEQKRQRKYRRTGKKIKKSMEKLSSLKMSTTEYKILMGSYFRKRWEELHILRSEFESGDEVSKEVLNVGGFSQSIFNFDWYYPEKNVPKSYIHRL